MMGLVKDQIDLLDSAFYDAHLLSTLDIDEKIESFLDGNLPELTKEEIKALGLK